MKIIVAMSNNNVIGINNKLPWHLSDDLKRFKSLTQGNQIVMGRKTFESIGRPLPNRDNIIITRDLNSKIEGVKIISKIEDIPYSEDQKTFIIGGGEIYSQTINLCDELFITQINSEIQGDTFFPEINSNIWKVYERSGTMIENKVEFEYITYHKV
jgi:dihydrofolate reductase